MTPHFRQSFLAALIGHFALIIAVIVVSVLPGCRHPKPVDLSSFANVDIRNIETTKPLSRIKPPPENVIPPPPLPPTDVRDPGLPPDPVPPRPVVAPTPKPPDRDTEGTLPDRSPPHDRIKPAVSNAADRTAVSPVPVVRSAVRTTRVLTTPGVRRAPRMLTPGELDPLGGLAAPIGASNSVPMDERQRCLLLIKRALYDVWDRPTLADAGHQPTLLEVRFDVSGRVVSAAVSQSAGSEAMDRSVLLAAKRVTRVEGLTPVFLKEYPKLTIEFTVTE
ncbi:MAG: energy transducer TonB [bacterium]